VAIDLGVEVEEDEEKQLEEGEIEEAKEAQEIRETPLMGQAGYESVVDAQEEWEGTLLAAHPTKATKPLREYVSRFEKCESDPANSVKHTKP
jgi:hypothetical protein